MSLRRQKPAFAVASVATMLLWSATSCTSTAQGPNANAPDIEARSARPPSARAALEGVLRVIEDARAKGHSIELDAIGASARDETVSVSLELLIVAEDEIVASQHYADLVGVFESSSWCAAVEPSTTIPILSATKGLIPEGSAGLRVANLKVVCKPARVELRTDPAPSMEPFIRSVAVNERTAIGPVNIKPTVRRTTATVDRTYAIRPARNDSLRTFERVMNFVTLLETESTSVVVTKVDLERKPLSGAGDETWDFRVDTTVRDAAR